ncbi:MAG: hypothetical protein Q9M28_07735 [Mariprofundaceae bacterium]|nr:hypothetical protein [Mariprofundaceae bacterium]
MVELLMVGADYQKIEHKGFIKKTLLPQEGAEDWKLLYNNKEDGIAIYANQEFGTE